MTLSKKEGEYLVGLSRSSIAYFIKNLAPIKPPKTQFPELLEKRGIFCTILTYPENSLRGCIGMIDSDKSLISTVIETSCSATQDSRFLPLKEEELNKITIELTILGKMEKILVYEPRDFLREIRIGRDGLYLKYHYNCGIFLPQVPVEQKWDVKTYLSELCMKSGMNEDAWITKPIKLYKFQAQIFSESEPNCGVFEKYLKV